MEGDYSRENWDHVKKYENFLRKETTVVPKRGDPLDRYGSYERIWSEYAEAKKRLEKITAQGHDEAVNLHEKYDELIHLYAEAQTTQAENPSRENEAKFASSLLALRRFEIDKLGMNDGESESESLAAPEEPKA